MLRLEVSTRVHPIFIMLQQRIHVSLYLVPPGLQVLLPRCDIDGSVHQTITTLCLTLPEMMSQRDHYEF